MSIKSRVKDFLFARRPIALIVFPLYAFFKYPIHLLQYGTIDPPEYFIFKQKKLIYLVNSKVAQTAITNTCGNSNKTEYSGIAEKHLGEKKFKLRGEEREYFAFTFIRNPFERLASCYQSKYIADREKYNKPYLDFDFYMLGLIRRDRGFEKFARCVARIPDRLADRHFKSQHALIYRESKKQLDFVGRYEKINEDFEQLRGQFDLDELPHLNKSETKKADWRDRYTLELVDLIEKRYRRDLDTWYPTAAQELRDYLSSRP
jgi:chondroitin 4-sulfotransferase 11